MAQLFNQLSKNTIYSLNNLPKIIDKVFPLKSKHKMDLPFAINDLSTLLTVQRSELKHSYWSTARFASAYLRYFFPWNVIRLTRLFQDLDICAPYENLQPQDTSTQAKLDMRHYNKNKQAIEASQDQRFVKKIESDNFGPKRLLVDLGSGPLTVPIALWFAKPEWRKLPLVILCLDTSPQPLEYGKQIFYALAGSDSPWQIVTRRSSISNLHKELRNIDAKPWLLTGANVINELFLRTTERYEENFAEIGSIISSFCNQKDAAALFVEPGTRLGGKNIALLREKSIENNLRAVAPCVHGTACPLQDSRSWCHFTFSVEGAPRWLMDLSHSAFLTKTALSLSFVLIQSGLDAAVKKAVIAKNIHKSIDLVKTEDVRIVSAPFKIPTLNGMVRYACSSQGLIIVKDAVDFTSGSTVKISWASGDRGDNNGHVSLDKKTGVRIVDPYNEATAQILSNNPNNTKNRREHFAPTSNKNRREQSTFVDNRNRKKPDYSESDRDRKNTDYSVNDKDSKKPNSSASGKEIKKPNYSAPTNDNDRKKPNSTANAPEKKIKKPLSKGKGNKAKNSFFGK